MFTLYSNVIEPDHWSTGRQERTWTLVHRR